MYFSFAVCSLCKHLHLLPIFTYRRAMIQGTPTHSYGLDWLFFHIYLDVPRAAEPEKTKSEMKDQTIEDRGCPKHGWNASFRNVVVHNPEDKTVSQIFACKDCEKEGEPEAFYKAFAFPEKKNDT